MTTSAPDTTRRTADSSEPLHELLDERWSPRSYDPEATIDDAELTALLEAARWAPSASNHQPRRFIAGRRGTATFDSILAGLVSFNAQWAERAALLVVAIAEPETEAGDVRRWAEYDLGTSIAHLTVQAHALGLHVHQMGGIDVDALRASFDLDERLVPVTVTAVGVVAGAELLEGVLAERETQPRTRLPLDEVVLRSE